MDSVSTSANTKEDGNTETSSAPKRRRNWCFTINNPNEDYYDTLFKLSFCVKVLVYQEETGIKGTPHLQGYLEYNNAVGFNRVKKDLPTAHIEVCRNKKASIKYCQKDEGRINGPFCYGLPEPAKPIKIITELRQWQKQAVAEIDFEDDRTIHWYWEPNGNIGKSAFAKYLAVKKNSIMVAGAAKDMKYLIAKHVMDKNQEKLTYKADNLIVVCDFPRSSEGYISYSALEQIKNGYFSSTKYNCTNVIINSPHIICFANFEPDTTLMSKDRWKITELNTSPARSETHLVSAQVPAESPQLGSSLTRPAPGAIKKEKVISYNLGLSNNLRFKENSCIQNLNLNINSSSINSGYASNNNMPKALLNWISGRTSSSVPLQLGIGKRIRPSKKLIRINRRSNNSRRTTSSSKKLDGSCSRLRIIIECCKRGWTIVNLNTTTSTFVTQSRHESSFNNSANNNIMVIHEHKLIKPSGLMT